MSSVQYASDVISMNDFGLKYYFTDYDNVKSTVGIGCGKNKLRFQLVRPCEE